MSEVAEKKRDKLSSISSLLESVGGKTNKKPSSETSEPVNEIEISKLSAGKYQPRREFDETALNELATSIKSHGVMQPIIVRNLSSDSFEIIAGERRWRAAQIAGLTKVPVLVKDIDDKQAIALALIENMQREDLSPLEEAYALQRLKDEFELKNKEVAEVLGKQDKYVSQILGLLKLPEPIKNLIDSGTNSPQILSVLARCHKLDAKATEKFVSGQDSISYRQAQSFQEKLKTGDETEEAKPADKKVTKEKTSPVVMVEYEGTSWELMLNKPEKEEGFCWVKSNEDSKKVPVKELTLLSVS